MKRSGEATAGRTSRRAWGLFAVVVIVVVAMVAVSAGREETYDTISYGFLSLTLAGAGALIVARHGRHAIGWLFLAHGLFSALAELGEGWGHLAAETGLPGGLAGEWVIQWSWIVDIALFSLVFLLFPTGKLPSRRWRALVGALGAGTVLAVMGQALGEEIGPSLTSGSNPVAVEALPTELFLTVGMSLMMLAFAAALVSLVVRFRRGGGIERQQIKWIATAATLILVVNLIALLPVGGEFLWYRSSLVQVAVALAFVSLPIAVCLAIIRYRLYDIDLVVNRALVYGALTTALAATYIATVLVLQFALSGLTSESDFAVAASTLAVAAAFRPARTRIQRTVDRRFYRRRYDARRTLEGFSAGLRDQVDLPALQDELQSVVAMTLEPEHVSVWMRQG